MGKYQADKMGTEPILKLLWSMGSQTVFSVLLYSIYALTDTYFVARGVGAYAAGGVSLAAPLLQIIGAVSTTVGVGGASIISRALGRNDKEKAANTAANCFLLFWISALSITVMGLLFINSILNMLGADALLLPYAKGYSSIILLGAITATGFSNLIRAEGNTRFSLYIWILPVTINLVLDPLLIFTFGLGVKGAAWATVIAQSVSAGMSIYYFFFSKQHAYGIKRKHLHLEFPLIKEICLIGSPSLISQLSISLFTMIVNKTLGTFGGAAAISAFGIISRLKSFLAMPITGIVQGMQPIVGFNHAANKLLRVKKTVQLSIAACVIYGFLVLAVCLIGPKLLVGIFITEEPVLSLGVEVLKIVALSFPFMGTLTIVSAYFQSIGKIKISFALPFIGTFGISMPILFLMTKLFALKGIWYTFVITDGIMCLLAGMLFYISFKKQMNKGED